MGLAVRNAKFTQQFDHLLSILHSRSSFNSEHSHDYYISIPFQPDASPRHCWCSPLRLHYGTRMESSPIVSLRPYSTIRQWLHLHCSHYTNSKAYQLKARSKGGPPFPFSQGLICKEPRLPSEKLRNPVVAFCRSMHAAASYRMITMSGDDVEMNTFFGSTSCHYIRSSVLEIDLGTVQAAKILS